MRCPRRPHGIACHNPRLPPTVPIIGLGCSSFSTFFLEHDHDRHNDTELMASALRPDHPTVRVWVDAIRHAVLDRGVDLLDTAPWYGHGTSEIVIGFAMEGVLIPTDEGDEDEIESGGDGGNGDAGNEKKDGTSARMIHRSSIIINTKIGRYDHEPSKQFDFSYDRVLNSAALSVERMKCRYIDVLQLHDPEFAPSVEFLLEETIPAMMRCRDELGLCKALGVTGYPLGLQHEILVRSGSREGMVFDQSLTYCHYNLHNTSLFNAAVKRKAEVDSDENDADSLPSFAEYCLSHRIGLQAAAPLSMGLFTRSGPPQWHPASSALKSACRRAAEICSDKGVDIASLATLFALAERRIPCTLLGMKDANEVDRAVEAACRFTGIGKDDEGDADARTTSPEEVLDSILTDPEKEALRILRDGEGGPFAEVWAVGDGTWDGDEVEHFWSKVPGGREGAEARMRMRMRKR